MSQELVVLKKASPTALTAAMVVSGVLASATPAFADTVVGSSTIGDVRDYLLHYEHDRKKGFETAIQAFSKIGSCIRVEGLEEAPSALEAYCVAGRDQHFIVEPIIFVRKNNSDVVTAVKNLTDSF
ncbi:MAG: hypothetical protein H0T78_05505, partial [Longispora sp.]|nr:hypothetical protein [Longispora sp. (in: high G+C Gram-positive bacteria)]